MTRTILKATSICAFVNNLDVNWGWLVLCESSLFAEHSCVVLGCGLIVEVSITFISSTKNDTDCFLSYQSCITFGLQSVTIVLTIISRDWFFRAQLANRSIFSLTLCKATDRYHFMSWHARHLTFAISRDNFLGSILVLLLALRVHENSRKLLASVINSRHNALFISIFNQAPCRYWCHIFVAQIVVTLVELHRGQTNVLWGIHDWVSSLNWAFLTAFSVASFSSNILLTGILLGS